MLEAVNSFNLNIFIAVYELRYCCLPARECPRMHLAFIQIFKVKSSGLQLFTHSSGRIRDDDSSKGSITAAMVSAADALNCGVLLLTRDTRHEA